ncbi:hypothetical protein [Sediminibacillus massiliensis]|nr:hypothetical protein [Sediminibacillus massiliensis]
MTDQEKLSRLKGYFETAHFDTSLGHFRKEVIWLADHATRLQKQLMEAKK